MGKTEEIPYSDYPRNWYFIKDRSGARVPLRVEEQRRLEDSDDLPRIKMNYHVASMLLKYEDRVVIKHPWKNDTPVDICKPISLLDPNT